MYVHAMFCVCACALEKRNRIGDVEIQEDKGHGINKTDDPAFLSILLPLIFILKNLLKLGLPEHLVA